MSICRVIGGKTIHLISKLKYWSGHRCPRGIRWLSSLGSLGCGRRCQWGCNCCCRTRWPLLQPQMLNLQHGSLQLSLKIPAFWVLLETGFASRRWNQHVKKSNRHVGNMVSYTISSLKLCLSKRYIMPQKKTLLSHRGFLRGSLALHRWKTLSLVLPHCVWHETSWWNSMCYTL